MSSIRPAAGDRWWARYLVPAIIPALLIACYQWYASTGDSVYFPTLGAIGDAGGQLWFGPGFHQDVLPSLLNLAIGYVVGMVLGVALGVAIGRSPIFRKVVQPLISFGLTLPPVALLPVFLIIFGVGTGMHRGIIGFAVFFVAVVNTAAGVSAIDPVLDDVAAVYRLPRGRRVLNLVIPAASVAIIAAARIGLNVGVLVMVVSEMIGTANGIGAVTLLAQQKFAYAEMWAGIVLLAVIGIVLNLAFRALERGLLRRLGLTDTLSGGN